MKIKFFCLGALIIAFFMYYQQNPVYTIVIIILFIGVYLLFKYMKSRSGFGAFGFLKGNSLSQISQLDDFVTILMLQQLLGSNPSSRNENTFEKNKEISTESYTTKTKKEILELLED